LFTTLAEKTSSQMHFHVIHQALILLLLTMRMYRIVGTSSVDNMDIPTLLSVNNARDNLLTFAGTDLSQAQQNDPALQ